MKRAQNKTRRILMLIDALAPLRLPFTLQDAKRLLAEKNVDVCDKTILRDLELLYSMGFVYFEREPKQGSKDPALYKMNLKLTTNVETAAIKTVEIHD